MTTALFICHSCNGTFEPSDHEILCPHCGGFSYSPFTAPAARFADASPEELATSTTPLRYPRLWLDVARDRGADFAPDGSISGDELARVGIAIINGCAGGCQSTVAPYNSYQLSPSNPYAYCEDCTDERTQPCQACGEYTVDQPCNVCQTADLPKHIRFMGLTWTLIQTGGGCTAYQAAPRGDEIVPPSPLDDSRDPYMLLTRDDDPSAPVAGDRALIVLYQPFCAELVDAGGNGGDEYCHLPHDHPVHQRDTFEYTHDFDSSEHINPLTLFSGFTFQPDAYDSADYDIPVAGGTALA